MLDEKKNLKIQEKVRLSYFEMHKLKLRTLPAKELKNGERNLNNYTCERQHLMNKEINLEVLGR